MKQPIDISQDGEERALLVQVTTTRQSRSEAEDSIHELERLADTAGAIVVGVITQRREKPTPGLLVGEGKLGDIQLACRQTKANVVIVDNDLSAVQVNNLDLALGISVIDRTELILQIFARRASSAESQAQVELAQLQYLVSRIPVSRKQQRFQGGIGMKGPGESPLQLRNAPMRRRISELKRKLAAIQKRRRRTRVRRPWPLVSLVGYTNAGKSTLLNAMSSAGAYVDDRLFATLDTKTRLLHLGEGREVLLSDTVGFIRHLPHGLVASFRSTLDVASEADLLLIVADASHPRVEDHLSVVQETLVEIDAAGVPSLLVLNKVDRVDDATTLDRLLSTFPDACAISARKGSGLSELKAILLSRLEQDGRFVKPTPGSVSEPWMDA
ncbi:MAG: GTPase HflX [Verrucomicrobia bacterium]|nr:GTPase HflX [Verrucomicrobiota bacterium]